VAKPQAVTAGLADDVIDLINVRFWSNLRVMG